MSEPKEVSRELVGDQLFIRYDDGSCKQITTPQAPKNIDVDADQNIDQNSGHTFQ